MKKKEGIELKLICGSNVLLPHGMENLNFNKMIELNETGAFLWKSIKAIDFSEEDLISALLEEYEVEREVAQRDVQKFCDKLIEQGVIIK